ncbi:MAG: DUF1207 domain-containing protein [Thermoguttaceae bacterium]
MGVFGKDDSLTSSMIYEDDERVNDFYEEYCHNSSPTPPLSYSPPFFQPISVAPTNSSGHLDQQYLAQQRNNWQLLPNGLIYPSYLAGPKEPRISTSFTQDDGKNWLWDFTLGGRAGLIRYGSRESILPTGFQVDLEGAVSGRMDLMHERDMVADDFRFGFPITFGTSFWQFKFGYYHVSSHLGDEYMINNHVPFSDRINYYRESLVGGIAFRPHSDIRLYAEIGYALEYDVTTEPLEFQFGFEYSPVSRRHAEQLSNTLIRTTGWQGAPFFAVNAYLRQENDFGGNLSLQTGWQFRGESNHLFRIGLYYFTGKSEQYQFLKKTENRIGFGLWYDF